MIYPVVLLLIGILTVDHVTSSSCLEDQGIISPYLVTWFYAQEEMIHHIKVENNDDIVLLQYCWSSGGLSLEKLRDAGQGNKVIASESEYLYVF